MKKLSALMLLSATMILASCGKPAEKPEESKPAETTSQAQEESKAESQPAASTVESKPAASSAPAASTPAPASSSKPAGTSTPAPASSSTPAPASSSTPAAAETAMSVTAGDIVKEGTSVFVKLSGTISGYANADAMKMAFGLQHKDATSSGVADAADGEWLVGSATPAAADFKYAPTVTDGAFEVKIDVTTVQFVKGGYAIMLGTSDKYAAISLSQSAWGDGSAEINGVKILLRGDLSMIVAEDLPPVHLTEEVVVEEAGRAILKVGGELAGLTAEQFAALTVKANLERQVGGWKQNYLEATAVVEGTKGYVKIDVTDLPTGGYQVKISFDGTSSYPNTTMETESYDRRDNPTAIGFKKFSPYFATGEGVNDAAHLYGCCGLFIENNPAAVTAATTRFEAETLPVSNATVEAKAEDDTATSGTGYVKEMTVTGNNWNRTTSQIDLPITLAAADLYTVKVAYKSADATDAGAFNLTIDNSSKGSKGAAAAAWTVFESDVMELAAGDHTITVKGISNVKVDIDYIELVKHDHMASATWGEAVAAADGLCAYTPGTCETHNIVKMAAGADLNGKLTTGGKLGKGTSGSYDGTRISSYKFNAAAAGTVSLYMEGAFDATGNDARGFYSGKNGSATYDYNAEAETHPTNTLMKMNDVEITLPTAKYGVLLGTTTANEFHAFKVAEVAVVEGVNEFTITATNSYGLIINYFAILF